MVKINKTPDFKIWGQNQTQTQTKTHQESIVAMLTIRWCGHSVASVGLQGFILIKCLVKYFAWQYC